MGLFSKLKENIEKSKERQKMMMEKKESGIREGHIPSRYCDIAFCNT